MTLSRQRVTTTFDESGIQIWTRRTLLKFIEANRDQWESGESSQDDQPPGKSATQIINWLVKETPLEASKLDFPYRIVTRFI